MRTREPVGHGAILRFGLAPGRTLVLMAMALSALVEIAHAQQARGGAEIQAGQLISQQVSHQVERQAGSPAETVRPEAFADAPALEQPATGAAALPPERADEGQLVVLPTIRPVAAPVIAAVPLPEDVPPAGAPRNPAVGGMPVSVGLPQAPNPLPAAQAVSADRSLPRAALPFVGLIRKVAGEYGLDEELLHAVIRVESAYQPNAVSPKGAIGLMQVMPETGARFGFRRLEDPAVNVRAGAHYLKWLLERFDDDLPLALAAYNAGEGAVQRYQRSIPPFPETRDYVQRVLARYGNVRADVADSLRQALQATDLPAASRMLEPRAAAAPAAKARAAGPGVAAEPAPGSLLRLGLIADLLLFAPPRPTATCVGDEKPARGRRSRRSARALEEAMTPCDSAGFSWQR